MVKLPKDNICCGGMNLHLMECPMCEHPFGLKKRDSGESYCPVCRATVIDEDEVDRIFLTEEIEKYKDIKDWRTSFAPLDDKKGKKHESKSKK